jgi:hypothetical protein
MVLGFQALTEGEPSIQADRTENPNDESQGSEIGAHVQDRNGWDGA